MEKEISSGTMLGIVLIALAAVIGLGFGVFSIAKGVANEGTVNVQDNLGAVSESAFDDYNDKIVTGTMVKSAVTNFSGKSVAILINTTAMDKAVSTYKGHEKVCAIKLAADNTITSLAVDNSKTSTTEGNNPINTTKLEADDGHYYINYNALLELWGSDLSALASKDLEGTLVLKDGAYNATNLPFLLDEDTGKVMFDNTVGGFSRTGNCEYIAATAKFDANLIKDESGTTIGIVFTQRAK